MPHLDSIICIPGLRIEKVEEKATIEIFGEYDFSRECQSCGFQRCRLKDRITRRIRHSKIGNKLIFLTVAFPKFKCVRCRKYFMGRLPQLLPYKQSTEVFREEIFERHWGGTCLKEIARGYEIGTATVERWFHDKVERRVKELSSRRCPRVLGIDEHFFSRKQGYATTLVDLHRNHVFDVVLGRSEKSLAGYFKRLKGRDRVQVIVMDMAETYRSIAKKYFPNALIVSDRFHVVRLINHAFLNTWKRFDPDGRKNRGLLSLMRRHPWKLNSEQEVSLMSYLKKHPALEAVYHQRTKLLKTVLHRSKSKNEIRPWVHDFLQLITELKDCAIDILQALGKTLESWKEEIGRMWRFSKTNSTTEGFHNKMELIARRAFGFRNFNNYRLRVLALCGWDGINRRF